MSERINLEQLASFLKDTNKQTRASRKERKRLKKERKKLKKEKSKSTLKFVDSDTRQARQAMLDKLGVRANITNSNLVDGKRVVKFMGSDSKATSDDRKVGDLDTRSGMVNKLGIKQNVTDYKEVQYEKFKKKVESGYGTLIYALQKDVKDIQNRFMMGPNQPQERPTQVRGQIPSRVAQQTGFTPQDKNASFDSAIQAQRVATENKKNQDRIEKEAKAELKRLDVESKAEVKRIEREAKEEQVRAREEQKELEKRQAQIERKEEEFTRLIQIRADREIAKQEKEEAKEAKVFTKKEKGRTQLSIKAYTIAQGMRTFTDFAPNPPDIGGGGGLPPLPFNRERDQYDPLEPTPFYRSTADRVEAPVLQEVLDAMTAPQEGISMTQEELPSGVGDESMTDEALLSLSTGMPEVPQEELPPAQDENLLTKTDENLLGGGGSAITPKKRGRPAGSKNKPKPQPSEPSQVAMIGSSSVAGKTPKGKTPANSPI